MHAVGAPSRPRTWRASTIFDALLVALLLPCAVWILVAPAGPRASGLAALGLTAMILGRLLARRGIRAEGSLLVVGLALVAVALVLFRRTD